MATVVTETVLAEVVHLTHPALEPGASDGVDLAAITGDTRVDAGH